MVTSRDAMRGIAVAKERALVSNGLAETGAAMEISGSSRRIGVRALVAEPATMPRETASARL